MNPQEKLSEIKTRHTELTLSQHISDAHVNWLIARVEQLEEALEWQKMHINIFFGNELGTQRCEEALYTGPKPE